MTNPNFDWWNFDAYLFDIDGTLVNSHGRVHYESFHTALREVYGCEGRIDPVPIPATPISVSCGRLWILRQSSTRF